MSFKENFLLGSFRVGNAENIALARLKASVWFSHAAASFVLVLFAAILFQFDLDGLKGLLVDALYRTQWWSKPDPQIVLVSYDELSSQRYDGSSKIPVVEFQKLLQHVGNGKPKAVGIIASVSEKHYNSTELSDLASILVQSPRTLVGYIDDESLGKPAPAPLRDIIRYYPGFISRDTFSYGADSVTRRVMISIDGFSTAYAELAKLMKAPASQNLQTFKFRNTESYGRGDDSLQTYVNWQGGPSTYSSIPSYLVAEGRIAPEVFENKLVLIGNVLTLPKTNQFVLTPHSRKPFETSFLEGAAHSVSTLVNDIGLKRTPFVFDFLFSVILGVITVNLIFILSPAKGILLILGEILGLFAACWIGLFTFNLWINLAHPLILASVAYYMVIPYRLLNEYRERWHYQEKSELMSQLEELKTNFLSLVSHDLKTPIARIQGNAELVLSSSDKIDEKQKKSLQGIVKTTEELSEYVQTILDLTRIESASLPVNKTSKDINAIVKEVIESKRFLAADKNISFRTELEPIFSFKFDVKLITRVLSNLLENAIKYSPPNTEIVLSSKEDDNWIRVSIADQGVGIAPEEQEKVFLKFYRCKNPNTETEKGTGLGLYLVKYFVELHRGMVELKSDTGKGSVFTVSLPI